MAYDNTGYETDRWSVLPSFRFVMRVEAAFDVPLKSIRPFTKENEYEQIEEGGMNDYVVMKRKHVTKPHTLQIERYLTDSFYDPMPNGTAFVLPLLLFVGGNNADNFAWAPRRTYVFFGAQVLNKEIGGFDAEKSGLLTETITIAYHQMYMMDTPFELEETPWNYKDNGVKNKFANQGIFDRTSGVPTKKEAEEKAAENLWEFGADASEYLGNGVRASGSPELKIPQNKLKKKQFESAAKANTWNFPKDSENDFIGSGVQWSGRPDQKIPANKLLKKAFASKAKQNTWHFAKDGSYLGDGMRYSGSPDQDMQANRMSVEQFTAKSNKDTWHFAKSGAEYTGNGKMHATHNKDEKNLEEMSKLAKQNTWPKASHAMTYPTAGESKEDFLKG